jgi:hypothetical protein
MNRFDLSNSALRSLLGFSSTESSHSNSGNSKSMLRRFFVFSMALALVLTSVACGSNASYGDSTSSRKTTEQPTALADSPRLSDGTYPVQQATYNDIDGEYTLMLLNTAPGQSAAFRTTDLQMAQLTEEEVKAGKSNYLKVEQGKPSLHLTKDSRIEYVHNVTETQADPQTGEQQVVVVRQEPSFWTPFAGALAGQALGSLLFRPQYYFPPVYQPGGVMTGYGGYGRTYTQAAESYQTRYSAPPVAVRNQRLRTTGQLRSPSRVPSTARTQTNRPSGSGYGSSTLRRSPASSRPQVRPKSNRSFGSGSRARSGGRRR